MTGAPIQKCPVCSSTYQELTQVRASTSIPTSGIRQCLHVAGEAVTVYHHTHRHPNTHTVVGP